MGNARLDEAQSGIKIARRNINNLRYADDTHHPMAESEEELERDKWLTHLYARDKWLAHHHVTVLGFWILLYMLSVCCIFLCFLVFFQYSLQNSFQHFLYGRSSEDEFPQCLSGKVFLHF